MSQNFRFIMFIHPGRAKESGRVECAGSSNTQTLDVHPFYKEGVDLMRENEPAGDNEADQDPGDRWDELIL